MPDPNDEKYMRLALDLAGRAWGRTWPNPMVGAVLVRGGEIVGRGWHRRCGGPHAEIHALREAGAGARGATCYVTLEPCSHYGKTPPCAPALIRAGVKRVVAAMQDPNPKVSGRGLKLLRAAGIKVEVGLLGKEARRLNEVFVKRIRSGLPFVICKAAMSLDGKIACGNGESRWISSLPARRFAHRLRAAAEVVIVGGGTVCRDNPALNVRLAKAAAPARPIRLVLEGKRTVAAGSQIVRTAARQPVIIATARRGRHPLAGAPGVEVWPLPAAGGRVDVRALLRRLGERGISLILVEGGAETHAAFLGLDTGHSPVLADRIHFILAPLLLGGRRAPGPVGGLGADRPDRGIRLRGIRWEPLGPDWLMTAKPVRKGG